MGQTTSRYIILNKYNKHSARDIPVVCGGEGNKGLNFTGTGETGNFVGTMEIKTISLCMHGTKTFISCEQTWCTYNSS